MKEFNYVEKETYTAQEVKDLLNQNKQFHLKDKVDVSEITKLKDELKPFKEKAKATRIFNLVKELTDEDKIKDAIQLSNLSDDLSDDDVLAKVKSTIQGRKYLQRVIETPETKTKLKDKESKKTPQPKQELKFVKSWDD